MRVFFARLAAFFAAILFWVWLVGKLALDWIGRSTAADDFNQLVERLPMVFGWLAATPWWVPGGLAGTLTAFLMWAGWPTDRAMSFGVSRKEKYQTLGVRALQVAAAIDHFQTVGKWVGNGGALGAEVYAIMVRFHDAGFAVPQPDQTWDQDRQLRSAYHYLSTMGVLLRDGSVVEAKLAAGEISSESGQAKFARTDSL